MADTSPHKLFLLDAMALVYRAHFAFISRPIVNSNGFNTSAIFGFTNTLIELLKKEKPTHLAVVFDTPAATPRHVLFPEYKAQREAMPEDLSKALPWVKKLTEAFNIAVLAVDGYEADDVIGTLARAAEARGDFVTYMVTPDKDFAQLVDSKTFIYKPGRQGSDHEILDTAKICEIWGVERPEQVIDILALWGDSVDNIPGVPGVGEKTAKALIAQFGSVEAMLERVSEIKGKVQEKVASHADQARLCKKLTAIITDAPLPLSLDDLKLHDRDDEKLKELFTELEFKTLGQRLFGKDFNPGRGFESRQPPASPDGELALDFSDDTAALDTAAAPSGPPKTLADVPHDYQLAKKDTLKGKSGRQMNIAAELSAPEPSQASLVGLAVSWKEGEASYFPCSQGIPAELKALLEDAATPKLGYDLKPLLQVLAWNGVSPAGEWRDLMLAQAIVDPDQRQSYTYLCESMLGRSPVRTGDAKTSPDQASDQLFLLECDEDILSRTTRFLEMSDLCGQLWAPLEKRLTATKQLRIFTEIETPLLPVLAKMEKIGIALDVPVLRQIGSKLGELVGQLETSIQEAAGTTFNVASPKQLGQVLFEKLRLVEKPKKTKTGQYMTGEEILTELVGTHPIVQQILDHREASKLKSTYADALPTSISRRSNRVHTTYQQNSTATGRLASNSPNLQNIPIRTPQGREIRKAFISGEKGWRIASADYSQIELRVMAALSKDPQMTQAFRDGLDIHQATAANVYGAALPEVTPEMRRTAKMVNFGIIYGISAFGLAHRLGIARSEAQRLIDEYFAKYPSINHFMNETIAAAKTTGYVATLSGRRRYLRDISSANATIRKAAERTAINTPIQGTAADMIKIAMVRVANRMTQEGFAARLLLQVHDELVFEAPEEELPRLQSAVVHEMQEALPLGLPIQVDFGSGPNWEEAH
jgi:DNA polymerase-1